MAVTENFFTGDGSTTSYVLTFEYIDEDDVKVSLDGSVTTAYSFANATTILFNTAPASDVAIKIYRDTDNDELKSTFFAGSSIRAQDLNKNFEQNNFAVQEIKNYTWDNETDTIHSDETWVSSDTQIATTAAMDARFQDEATETIESGETWVSDDDHIATTAAIDARFQDELSETITSAETWANNDDTIATTAAIDNQIDQAITNDIGTDGTGITITDDGDGTITLGLGSSSIDLDRIKAEDIITQAEQTADYDLAGDDDSIFTSSAAIRRFENFVQNSAPSGTGIGKGRVWVDVDDDLTLSVWNGSQWLGITSGGTFTNQPQVVYVDANSGDDNNDGHRISRPKASIKAAINQINADATYGDGSVVIVAAGVYQEAAPIQIDKKNVSIIGQALRSCVVHPTVATETNTLFELNSGSYVANLTLTGIKAGTGTGNTLDATLPTTQGWNFAFRSGATITKSPYIQNCTNFSDSEIDNDNLNAVTPAGGAAGDTDSAPTGGGLLVNGATVSSSSPLRSMVCDSYTHVGLNGPGILVTNNGYVQATSSYAFFNKYHIKFLNGGQANLAASTTDFGDQALVADGKSTTNIFTANCVTAVDTSGAAVTTIRVSNGNADASWHGSSTRPQTNMLLAVNSEAQIYPILQAVPQDQATYDADPAAYTGDWIVTVSRPNPTNRSENLGFSDDVAAGTDNVQFFLRSQIASSGHTMEYVGSGTDYRALPENGGVPVDANQVVESNDGKVWTATTDHNGKFKIGDFFEVDQQLGFVTIPNGSIAFDLASDPTPELSGNLDANSNRITDLADPTAAQDAATKNYVDTADATKLSLSGGTMTGDITFNAGQSFPGVLPLSGGTMTGDITFNSGQTIDGYVSQTATDGAANIPSGATGDRPTGVNGMFRYNNTDGAFEGYASGAWGAIGGGGGFEVSTTPPVSPSGGDTYWDSEEGNAYIYYEDGTSNQWVPLVPSTPPKNAAGGGTDEVFFENDNAVTTNYTLQTGKNALSAGPITINSGVTVTVPSGQSWVIV